jgi:hypothetical protein
MSLTVEQKFVVGDKIFDTADEAQEYLEQHQDQLRIDAYTDFLRQNGAQRISRTITEHLMDFIKFEKGTLDVTTQSASSTEEEEVPEVSEDEIVKEEQPIKTDSKSLFADSDAEHADSQQSDEAAGEVAAGSDEGDDSSVNGDEEVPAALTEKPKPKGKSLFA